MRSGMHSESGRDQVMGVLTWAGLMVITLTPSSCSACTESHALHQTPSAKDALTSVPVKVFTSGRIIMQHAVYVRSYLQKRGAYKQIKERNKISNHVSMSIIPDKYQRTYHEA